MVNILHISRLQQDELKLVLKMFNDEDPASNMLTKYRVLKKSVTDSEDSMGEELLVELNEYNSLVANETNIITLLSTYEVENVLDPEMYNSIKIITSSQVPYDTEYIKNNFDLIVVGMGDAGVDIFSRSSYNNTIDCDDIINNLIWYSQLEKLSELRDLGIPIIFTHDCLEINSFVEPFPPEYDSIVGNFGIGSYSFVDDELDPIVNNITCTLPQHKLMTSYYELPSILDVQQTHLGGLTLKNEAEIIYKNTSLPDSRNNYYLALYEETGKGKIALIQMGHSDGNFNQFVRPSIDECKIMINLIDYLLS